MENIESKINIWSTKKINYIFLLVFTLYEVQEQLKLLNDVAV